MKHNWGLMLKSAKSGNREGLPLLGEYNYLTGSYYDAEKQLLSYLAAEPGSAKGRFILGKVSFMQGDRARALSLLLEARQAGGEGAKLLHAIHCLQSGAECDSLERAAVRVQENGE